uniref:Uncharacterized protein n=1 Tax=Gossypium raimondii TaxID=29730 RepID=A0A0D2N370_GOSRA|nr:hypothetical protein B456_001G160000 [Gossypium raimondii]
MSLLIMKECQIRMTARRILCVLNFFFRPKRVVMQLRRSPWRCKGMTEMGWRFFFIGPSRNAKAYFAPLAPKQGNGPESSVPH